MTDENRHEMYMWGRMIDLGHVPTESVVHRVLTRLPAPDATPSDEWIVQQLAVERTRQDIQDCFQ